MSENKMKEMVETLTGFGKRYELEIETHGNKISIIASNINLQPVKWIVYNFLTDNVSLLGNTDNCNIWLHETRKDFTPEKCIEFVKDLNDALGLKDPDRFLLSELIDPEDWQEIAHIHDASMDERYATN